MNAPTHTRKVKAVIVASAGTDDNPQMTQISADKEEQVHRICGHLRNLRITPALHCSITRSGSTNSLRVAVRTAVR
jgi:hypothetical protein